MSLAQQYLAKQGTLCKSVTHGYLDTGEQGIVTLLHSLLNEGGRGWHRMGGRKNMVLWWKDLPGSPRPSRVRWRERSGVLSSTVTATLLSHMPD